MKIIVISHNRSLEDEDKIITRLFEYGLETFHLRKPRMSTKKLEELIKKIPAHFHNRIVLHTHHNLCARYDLKGIHITRNHLNRLRVTKWKLFFLSLRRSLKTLIFTTSKSQLQSVYDIDEFQYEYIFLNPVFDPLTGKFQNGFHEEVLKAANAKSGKKIIARGGVNPERLRRVKELGFYGFAVNSYIWKSPDPIKAYLEITNECRQLDSVSGNESVNNK